MRAIAGLLALLACLLGAMSSGHAQPLSLRDDRGLTLRFDRPPQRIVSLLPSLTESVCALGACQRLVGTDRFSNWPTSVAALPKLGGLDDAQIERIVALRPDVVLTAKSARVVERLETLGLTVLVLEAQTHADVQRTLTLLATLLGTPERASPLWAGIEKDLATAAARVPAAQRGRAVYFEVAAAPYAAGAASFIGETLARLGLANIVPREMGPFPQLNPEYVLRAQPAIVMAARRELDGMATRPGWSQLSALKQHQRCGFDNAPYDMLVRPGPRMGEAALLLADCVAKLPSR
jgi:iron complex transport system substrate-binding protein